MMGPYIIQCNSDDSCPAWLNSITPDGLDSLIDKDFSCFLLDTDDCGKAYEILEKIRSHPVPAIYLKAVVLVQRTTQLEEEFTRSFDAVIDGVAINEEGVKRLSTGFDSINRWIGMLDSVQYEHDRHLALKVVRYFASRSYVAEAITTLRSKSGFIYPVLEPFFGFSDGGVLTTLEYLEQQHLLSGEFHTKARFCNHCESPFLNFKEVCPHCGSADLSVDELVHHFKCGYTAELTDFQHAGDLVCPKCDRVLKHIGVDYDKPSIMHRCNSCAHPFQEPDIMTSCFSCGRSTEPENLHHRSIKKYSITSIGRHAARFGLESLFGRIIEDELQLISYANFARFVEIESARIERYKLSQSTLMLFYLKGLSSLYARLGARAEDMFREISGIIESILRNSDVITAKDEEIFAVMLTETNLENAQRAVERMKEGVSALVEENLGNSLELITELHEMPAASDHDKLLEQFLEKHID